MFFTQLADAGTNPDAFIITVKTDNVGITANDTFRVQTTGTGYNYDVNWGDDSSDIGQTGNISHIYSSIGTYDISITGTFPRIYFNDEDDCAKIIDIKQWGTGSWTSMFNAFAGCSSLTTVTATDAPDLSSCTDFGGMWQLCINLTYVDFSGWNTSTITAMNSMFDNCSVFNAPVPFNTGLVTTMFRMFKNCNAFNQSSVSSFLTAEVTTMYSMFEGCAAFNQPLITSGSVWDVSRVITMRAMFANCSSFNQSISTWDTSLVTSFRAMFIACTSFNSSINITTSSGTDFVQMFYNCSSFDQAYVGSLAFQNVTDPAVGMVDFCGGTTQLSTANYNTALFNFYNTVDTYLLFDGVTSFGLSTYSVTTYRGYLTGYYGWTITDGGVA